MRTLPGVVRRSRFAICDLDGTLVDSDRALADAFVALGVPRDEVTYGHVVAEECARWGLTVSEYEAAYDDRTVEPFVGVPELVAALGDWAVCSNKLRVAGEAELTRFGWTPTVALFADAFDGAKSPVPILRMMGMDAVDAVFVGDTAHDRSVARDAGLQFVLAGWNPRAVAAPGDVVLRDPLELLDVLAQST